MLIRCFYVASCIVIVLLSKFAFHLLLLCAIVLGPLTFKGELCCCIFFAVLKSNSAFYAHWICLNFCCVHILVSFVNYEVRSVRKGLKSQKCLIQICLRVQFCIFLREVSLKNVNIVVPITDKKENQIFLMSKDIQKGSVAIWGKFLFLFYLCTVQRASWLRTSPNERSQSCSARVHRQQIAREIERGNRTETRNCGALQQRAEYYFFFPINILTMVIRLGSQGDIKLTLIFAWW